MPAHQRFQDSLRAISWPMTTGSAAGWACLRRDLYTYQDDNLHTGGWVSHMSWRNSSSQSSI
ncbi:sugar transporter [Aspergillus luchuensis]|uniref:Sugar transporter n=1 Tax=Aspergillus kawachii TaxID=1069201 RepID=A0A146F363_ASPKA|nr:sugar transporter [Aspergillus luchuensis]